MEISFIQPSRNNLKYLKWSYDSIRKNQGDHIVEICVADDASTDGTWEWCLEMMDKDPNFKAILNNTGNRLGHTILYDRLVNEVATKEVAMIYHADMYLCPGALDSIENHLYQVSADGYSVGRIPDKKTIVSLTRIEPPLHPDGPEKILRDYGVEPEEFKEDLLLEDLVNLRNKDKTTEGIFAPWAFFREDFQEIGGHDPLYAPQSKEDSDIFNRFQLNGVKFIQTWDGCVYHMTCRGSRRNTTDKATSIYQDSPEWLAQNMRSTRNFIRKWGHFVKHDPLMKPIIPPKYDIGIQLINGNEQLLEILEPWCTSIYTDINFKPYCVKEQPNTIYPLLNKMYGIEEDITNDITITVNGKLFSQNDLDYICEISSIIKDNGEVGEFELGNLKIIISQLIEYQDELINL
jgi:glycosyltransferase involved in cell wall biosynthesis